MPARKPAYTITGKKIIGQDWGTLTRYEVSAIDSAGQAQNHVREVYDHGNAAAILLLDTGRGIITLVRQLRLPPQLNGDDAHLLEACAGLLDGDTPETCARKEAIEETGIAPATVVHAFDIYPSPGSLSEKTYCFLGFYTEADRVGPGGGLAHEGEDIEIVEIGFPDALPMIASGAITDAKTVALLQHAALKGLLA